MADVVLNRVQYIPFLYGGCGIKSVTCIGDARAIVVFEEVDDGFLGYNPQRIFRSADNGASWTELSPYPSTESLWLWKSMATELDTLIVGNEGPLLCMTLPAPDQGIARSTDAGVTWTTAVDGDLSNGCAWTWDVQGFLRISDTEIWGLGDMGPFGNENQIIKSLDNGVTFTQASFFQLTPTGSAQCGVVVDANTIIIAGNKRSSNARVWRSTNGGVSFTEIVLPNTQHAANTATTNGVITVLWSDGTNVIAAGSQQTNAGGGFPPKVWRSTDQGATWSEITDSIPNWTLGNQNPVSTSADFGSGRLLIALEGRPDQLGNSNYRLTIDAGVTWTNATVGSHPRATSLAVFPEFMAVMDDGSVVVTLDYLGGNANEIWRGIPDFVAAGPCVAMVPTAPTIEPVEWVFEVPPILCPPALAQVLKGDWEEGSVRQIFAGDEDDDGIPILWTVLTRPAVVGTPQDRAYYHRFILKVTDVNADQAVLARAIFGPISTGTPRIIERELHTPSFVGLGLGNLLYNSEADLSMGLGLIATNARMILAGFGKIRIRGLEYHIKPKPLTIPSIYS